MKRLTRPRIVKTDDAWNRRGSFTVYGVGHDGMRKQKTFREEKTDEVKASEELLATLENETPDRLKL